MKGDKAYRLPAYISAAFAGGIFIVLLIFGLNYGKAGEIALASGVLLFIIEWYILRRRVFAKLAVINHRIFEAIRPVHAKSLAISSGIGSIDTLEDSVNRLIREKTLEINNLRELERMRKEFLGDVAHELRSPIFNIQGYIHTLIEGAMDDEEVSRKFLEKAARHVDHLSTLVEDLVTISRIEAGELKLEKTGFDIFDLIREVADLYEMASRQKNIAIILKFPEDAKLQVFADRPKISQVLSNLVSNSIKYGRENGTTQISVQEGFSNVTVEVSDNGEGIAEEHLPRIFERFYRVDKSRARTEPSTGLGLAIVKHFIEAHEQKIIATSLEGIGSIFSFTLEKATL